MSSSHLSPKHVEAPRAPGPSRISRASSGFSLVELVVSVGILGLMTTLILVGQARWNGTILLTNLAYDVALAIREAQIYGLSARETSPGSGDFSRAYGVYFTRDDPKSFAFFIDRDGNGRRSGSGEELSRYRIGRGNSIEKFCVIARGGEQCSPSVISALNITFLRPDPSAEIRTTGATTYAGARIYVASPIGRRKTIVVEPTGQISIQ